MVPSGPPIPVGGAQSMQPSLLRSNSNIVLGSTPQGHGGLVSSQSSSFPSLVSPRGMYNDMNMLGNMPNVSSLLNQSFANGGSNSGLSGSASLQRGTTLANGVESDPLSNVGNGMGVYNTPSVSFPSPNMPNPSNSGQSQGQCFPSPSGNQLAQDQQQASQLEPQNFQQVQQAMQQFTVPYSQQQQQQQQQQHYQSIRTGLGTPGPVKLEPQMSNDRNGQHQQLQSLCSLGQVKLESPPTQSLRNLTPVKMEPQHSDPSLFLQQQHQQQQQQQQQHQQQQQQHQQQQQQHQQQQFLHMSRQSSQAAAAQINILQQQRLLQMQQQQQQQQQLLKSLPQQRSQLQQQFQQQNLPVRASAKPAYEPGMCARRLTHYMYHQQHRPQDNNIEFWRKFVAEYFAPHAKKRWCVSQYGSVRQTTGVFPQDVWHCEICNRKPGRGFETTVEVLPRLCKIKYDSGTIEELLYVDMPREYQNASGQIVLDYSKAIQESVFEHLRVVRDGQLRIVFSTDLKICSWEFCARHHEELIPRRLITPQVSQLGATAQKYQAANQNASSNLTAQELQNNCNMFVASARQLAKALEVPLVNDLGYTKRYVRCLQISEVVNSMKDLIDYSRETGNGPMASLINFPRRNLASTGHYGGQSPLPEEQQQNIAPNANNETSVQANMQPPACNGVTSVNNSQSTNTVTSPIPSPIPNSNSNSNANTGNRAPSTTTSAGTKIGLLHQNSMNSRQDNLVNNPNCPFGGGGGNIAAQVPPAASLSSPLSQAHQPNPSSPFPSTSPPASNSVPSQQTSSNGTLPTSTTAAASVAGTGALQNNSANSPAAAAAAAAAPPPSTSVSMQQSTIPEVEPKEPQSSVQQIIQEMIMSSQLNGGNSMVCVGSSIGNELKSINGISGSAAINGVNCLVGNGNGVSTINSSAMGGSIGGAVGISTAASGIRAAAAAMGHNNSLTSNGRGMASMINQDYRNSISQHQQQELGNRFMSGLGGMNNTNFNNLQFDWKPSP